MGLFNKKKKKGKLISSSETFDSGNRHKDENGRLIVEKSLITKATVSQYYGQEIPNFEAIGLDPMKKYNVYRPLEELKKSLKKFDMLPLLDKHIMDYADMPQKNSRVGALGNPEIEGNGVYGSLSVWTSEAIQDIEAEEKRELSLGYNADYRLENGEFEGVPYEIVMENIRPNHLALVKKARVRGAAVFDEDKKDFLNQKFLESLRLFSTRVSAKATIPEKTTENSLPKAAAVLQKKLK